MGGGVRGEGGVQLDRQVPHHRLYLYLTGSLDRHKDGSGRGSADRQVPHHRLYLHLTGSLDRHKDRSGRGSADRQVPHHRLYLHLTGSLDRHRDGSGKGVQHHGPSPSYRVSFIKMDGSKQNKNPFDSADDPDPDRIPQLVETVYVKMF